MNKEEGAVTSRVVMSTYVEVYSLPLNESERKDMFEKRINETLEELITKNEINPLTAAMIQGAWEKLYEGAAAFVADDKERMAALTCATEIEASKRRKTIALEIMPPPATIKGMIDKFQCPGCVMGVDTDSCTSYEPREIVAGIWKCVAHSAGTFMMGVARMNLGLPIGFNRVQYREGAPGTAQFNGKTTTDADRTNIRLHESPSTIQSDKFNVPVWAMEQDGYLFIRTYLPRVDATYVDIIKDGTLSHVPNAIEIKPKEMD